MLASRFYSCGQLLTRGSLKLQLEECLRLARIDRVGEREISRSVELVGGDRHPLRGRQRQIGRGQNVIRPAIHAARAADDQFTTDNYDASDDGGREGNDGKGSGIFLSRRPPTLPQTSHGPATMFRRPARATAPEPVALPVELLATSVPPLIVVPPL